MLLRNHRPVQVQTTPVACPRNQRCQHPIKARIVANDKKSAAAPDLRVYADRAQLGAAWKARTSGDKLRDYLRTLLDGRSFAEPVHARRSRMTTAPLTWYGTGGKGERSSTARLM